MLCIEDIIVYLRVLDTQTFHDIPFSGTHFQNAGF